MADEDRYEAQARSWLNSVDVPPPRLAAGEIVQIGRGQARRRRLLAAGGAAAVMAVMAVIPAAVRGWPEPAGDYPAAEAATLDCTVTELTVPEGESQELHVRAMDPTGRYVAGGGTTTIGPVDTDTNEPTTEPAVAILWQDGVPTHIPAPHGGLQAIDVNSHGVVVGHAFELEGRGLDDDPVDSYGWAYSDGGLERLPAPPGYTVLGADGINDTGDIVGNVTDFDGDSRPAVWRSVGPSETPGEPETLPVPDGQTAHVADIAEDGSVVGVLIRDSTKPDGPRTAYLWEPNGVGRELPNPSGTTGGSALAISGEWVIGTADVPVPEGNTESPPPAVPSLGPIAPYEGGPPAWVQLPVRWNLRTGSAELIDPGVRPWRQFDVLPAAMSDHGDLLIDDLSVPLLLRGDQWFTLPFDGLEARPVAISADGTVIGGTLTLAPPARSGEPTASPVVWRC